MDDGSLYAEAAQISGKVTAAAGTIGSWIIEDGIVRSAQGVYGTYSYTTTGTDLRYATGYAFTALTSVGIRYFIKSEDDFSSVTYAIVVSLSTGTSTPGGNTGGTIIPL